MSQDPETVLKWTYTDTDPRNQCYPPEFGSEAAIGLDLRANSRAVVSSGEVTVVGTGIAIAIPPGYYGRIAPRSGLAVKFGADVLAGVIDSDYRGEIMVLLTAHKPGSFEIKQGDRIAQLILERAERPELQYVSHLGETARGAAGFGSTGTN
jgi:dUTP pyrophosphatase